MIDRGAIEEQTQVLRTVDPEPSGGSTSAAEAQSPEASAPPPPPGSNHIPQLANDVDLIGEYEGSGYKEPHFIARRSDGQVLQLSELLFLVANEVDGSRDYTQIAERVSERFGKTVSAENVGVLIEKLTPLGIVRPADGSQQELERADPMLALRFRTRVIPTWLVRAITFVFRPLFWPIIVVAVLAGLGVMDYYVFAVHGVAQGVREMLYSPTLMMAGFGLLLLSAMFHECGHATACRYGGAEPGVMGVGIYIVWPALYTDVTDAYRLNRAGRLRTDLGGLYFNSIFMLATLGLYFATHSEWLMVVILAQHVEMVHQLLPFLRLDGYYVVADLTGVPDMFMRIKPVLASLVPWRKSDERVTELKRWARAAVTAWVFIVIPVLLFIFANIVIAAPRILATAWDSFFGLYHKTSGAFGGGQIGTGAFYVIQMVFLTLPILGICYTFFRMFTKSVGGAWRWSADSAPKRGVVMIAAAGAIALMAYRWLPNDAYTPIRPGEKGTIGDAIAAVRSIPGGKPGIDYVTRSSSTRGFTPQDLQQGRGPSGTDGSGAGTSSSTGTSGAGVPAPGASSTPGSTPSPTYRATPSSRPTPTPTAQRSYATPTPTPAASSSP
ncbi:MAG: putative peptide zinc metalloprotease protein [Actinomycetota bacterium]|nr:putative peptide zinc metalloprotease protein [Actinomycetota bacterium]